MTEIEVSLCNNGECRVGSSVVVSEDRSMGRVEVQQRSAPGCVHTSIAITACCSDALRLLAERLLDAADDLDRYNLRHEVRQ